MQNKGFVIFITSLLALICAYYISFTPVVRYYDDKAKELEESTVGGGKAYLDSMANETVWFGMTLKKARTKQIGLGLDLKGGMNVVLRLNAGELLLKLSGNSEDVKFQKALELAKKSSSSGDFIDKFVKEYTTLVPDANLSVLFGNGDLRNELTARSTNEEVIKVLKKKFKSASDASINVLRTRIDRFGVIAPNIQRIEGEGRILVELPGVKDPERVRSLLQQTANLQFWRTYTYDDVVEDLVSANERLSVLASTEEETKENVLFNLLSIYNGGAVIGQAKSSDREKIDEMLALAHEKGFIRENLKLLWSNSPVVNRETKKETDYYTLYAIRGNRGHRPDLGGEVVTSAKSDMSQGMIGSRGPVVTMVMNEEGSRKWARLTKENIGQPIAVVLDDVVYSAPAPRSEITGGRSEISGDFTVEETVDLANVLNSGRMEASVTIEQENVIGPTLGKESIKSGIISFLIALILLMIYMCLSYGLIPGLIADAALIVNSFLTLGILASFHSVLTLSGIAGLVLTLGMAVDANVLIFERIKEELRAGKSMSRSIADGYGNAFSAIFDSNLTTIISGIILYSFGTGPIRGFATTLIIGIIASFITSVFLTRIWVEFLDKRGKMSKVTYSTVLTRNFLVDPKFNILGKRKIGLALPLLLIVAGLIGLFTIGLNKGIEFSGGRNFVISFDQAVSIEDVRKDLGPELNQKLVVTSIGNEGTDIRVATNYKIEENTVAVENEINDKLFKVCKNFYKEPVSKEKFLSESIISSQKVSASMSKDISRKAIIAVIISLIFMALYILLRFRHLSYSLGAFASVSVTTFCIISLYVLLWRLMPFTMEIDQNFIAAILAIIGYSINDTVVVFDRVRETDKMYPNRDTFTVMNDALSSTLSRTLNTSLTTFLVMFIIFIFGGASMRSFTFVILLGVIIGTYSTLFVASPVAYMLSTKKNKK